MRYFYVLIAFLFQSYLIYTQVYAQDNVIDEVICIVEDDVILHSDIERIYTQMKMDNQYKEGDFRNIFNKLIAQKLYLHQARMDSISIQKSQLFQMTESWINSVISKFGSKEKMEEYFGKSIAILCEEKQQAINEQSIIKLVQSKLINSIKITPFEVYNFYNRIMKDSLPFIPTTMELKIITLSPIIHSKEISDIKHKLIEYTKLIVSGKRKFSTLARLYSEDIESAKNGGELGFINKNSLPFEFAEAAFKLNNSKKVSKIVKTEYGYHIIQFIGKKGNYVNVRHILLKPHVLKEELKRIYCQLDTIRTNIENGKITFENAVTYVSQDKDTRNNKGLMVNYNSKIEEYVGTSRFTSKDLPYEIDKIICKMQVGDISKPFVIDNFKQKEVVAIIKLESKVDAHKANFINDYRIIKKIFEYEKQNQILNMWLEKKRRDVCIYTNDIWKNCDFQNKN